MHGTVHTNMNDVSQFVHHDVPVVSVLNLQEVAHQRIGRHAPYKVGTSLGREGGENKP